MGWEGRGIKVKQEENEQRSRRRKTENVVESRRDKFKWNQWQRTKKRFGWRRMRRWEYNR